ncbi:MAG: enoyl-CoA hydratase [Chloroflexi bacterium]|nr:enoyl-CoA hydratase [Chloroflexota bacterium]MDA1145906.1 enoyl-CoA hydratase [Chloroflexota bacterium]
MTNDVRVKIEDRERGRVATVTVDYQAKINILGRARTERLRDAFLGLADDERLRAVVLTGAGDRAFIGGADISEMVELTPATARTFITTLHEACAAIRDLPVPVIARIDGFCLGAGLEVAASCDLRVASDRSTFGMPEVRVGLPSVIEAALLPSLVGWGRTRELVYTGESWDAAEAQRAGLLERVVAPDWLDRAVEGWVTSILANGPRAIRAQKRLLAQWERVSLEQAIAISIDAFEATWEDDEPRDAMRAFIDRPRE